MTRENAHAPMPVIVGSPRSGTTLLRLLIDAHPQVAIPPETGFLGLGAGLIEGDGEPLQNFLHKVTRFPPDAPGWGDFHLDIDAFRSELARLRSFDLSAGLRVFYRLYAARFGKSRWGEKTPLYCHQMRIIEALLPEARFIHLVRDGRDAAVSLRERWFSPGYDIAIQASYWRGNVLAARNQGGACRHYLEVRYEDLIRHPESELRRICHFIEIEYHPHMLAHHRDARLRLAEHLERRRLDGSVVVTREERMRQQAHTARAPDPTRIGLWRNILTHEEIRTFNAIAGAELALFGYAGND